MAIAFRTVFLSACLALALMFASVAVAQDTRPAESGDAPVIRIYRHSAWATMPPKGVEAHGIRMNLGIDGMLEFEGLVLSVTDMAEGRRGDDVPEAEHTSDTVTISLAKGDEANTRTLNEGDTMDWEGFRIAIVAIYATKGDLGFNSTVFEVATLDSLPDEVATATLANGAEHRLRVKHTIEKLTLHHSATDHEAGDDLVQKMRNMQSWGESDRNWWDIPYHFIIDLDGSVLEARDYHYAGDTNTRYNPAGHFLINCYGNYSKAEPNEAQLATIANLMAWAAVEFDIDPLEIYGHRDLASTGCPSDNLYRSIEEGILKSMVEKALQGETPVVVWLDELPPSDESGNTGSENPS